MSKRDDLALKIVETVPKERLVGAALGIEQERRRRNGLPIEFKMEGKDVENLLIDLIQSATIRQLKMLRTIALGLEEATEH